MPGLTLTPGAAGRARGILLALAALVLLSAWTPGAAHASGCENTFTNTAGGSWLTGSNWSKKAVPTSGEEVCISEPGTYTVTLNGANVTVKALTVGGSSGTQTLSLGSTCSVNDVLATTAGTTVGAQGAVVLTNGDGCGDNSTLSGAVTSSGSITTVTEHGGARTLQGNLVNKGTLQVNANTSFNEAATTLTNEGALNVAEGKSLAVSNKAAVTNGSGGSINGTGGSNVFLGAGTTFTEGAGTTSGTLPVYVDDGTLAYTGAGASSIAVRGTTSLSGNIAKGQSLTLQSTCGEHAFLTAAAGYSNAGTITLTNGDGCGDNATLTTSAGTLANSGTIDIEHEHGGARTLQGNLTNTGTIAVNQPTSYNAAGAALTNEGALDLAEGVELSVTNAGSVTNGAGGSIAATGSGDVVLHSGTSFDEGAGTTSGTQPVIVDDGALTYGGGGASLIRLRGTSTLAGSSTAGQQLAIESTCSENASVTTSPSFANGGTTTLGNGDGCGDNATLAGTITNTGTIASEAGHGGARTLQGTLTNQGTLQVNAATSFNGAKGLLTNEGTVELAEAKVLTVSNEGKVANALGGMIKSTGSGEVLLNPGTTYEQGAGQTVGTLPVVVDDGTIAYTGGGVSTVAARGTSTLSGNLGGGQALVVQSTCSENAVLTANASYTSSGSITLTNGDGCGDNATLDTATGTLTNAGAINTNHEHGGARTLEGNLTNLGTITVSTNTSYNTPTTLSNSGTVDLAAGVALAVTGGATVTNEAGSITAAGNGALTMSGGTFNQGGGASSGTLPIVLDDLALHFTGTGKATIALRGTSTLSGNVPAGAALLLQSTCSEHAVVKAAASFTDAGTIALTNGDGCGDNATLELPAKATLTVKSTGTLASEHAAGGTRTIEGNLKDEGLLALGAGQALKVTGTYVQSGLGTLQTAISGAGSQGSIAVTGTAKLAGALAVVEVEPFLGKAGESFAVLSSSARSGTFSDLDGVVTKSPGRWYEPSYSATGVSVTDTPATLTAEPTEGAAGSKVKLTGTGFLPADKVKPQFTDAKKAKTTFTTVTVGAGGEFSVEVTLSSKAAKGAGEFTATSTNVTGLVVATPFTVS